MALRGQFLDPWRMDGTSTLPRHRLPMTKPAAAAGSVVGGAVLGLLLLALFAVAAHHLSGTSDITNDCSSEGYLNGCILVDLLAAFAILLVLVCIVAASALAGVILLAVGLTLLVRRPPVNRLAIGITVSGSAFAAPAVWLVVLLWLTT